MLQILGLMTVALLTLITLSCSKGADQRDNADFVNNSSLPLDKRSAVKVNGTYTTIEWTDLIPQDDLDALLNPPDYFDEIEDGSPEDEIASDIRGGAVRDGINQNEAMQDGAGAAGVDGRYEQALVSQRIIPGFDKQRIRIPGFIVPLEYNETQTITTFFLVPFFGACIHYPPPPPNQIISAEFEPGIKLDVLYDPFWIEGTLFTSLTENDMATAAYAMQVDGIQVYEDYIDNP